MISPFLFLVLNLFSSFPCLFDQSSYEFTNFVYISNGPTFGFVNFLFVCFLCRRYLLVSLLFPSFSLLWVYLALLVLAY